MKEISLRDQLGKMEKDWDRRARENAHFYVASSRTKWTEQEFYESGRRAIDQEILTDMDNICQGKDPKQMRVLEIGCGAGRTTQAFAGIFGEVHAIDVSSQMVKKARRALRGCPNAPVYKNNGLDLSVVPDVPFDFAFSYLVFQHIPNREIIESYIREVHRLLRPGALFKFQVQGDLKLTSTPDDTWVGAAISEEEAVEMGVRNGFEPRHLHGAGQQYFWLWYFKREIV